MTAFNYKLSQLRCLCPRHGTILCDSLESILFRRYEPMHVAAQEKVVGKATHYPPKRFPFKGVAHGGYPAVKFEFVNMTQPFETTSDHLVVEALGPFEHSNSRAEALFDAKVAAFEGDQIAKLEQPLGAAWLNDSLGGECG